MTNNEFDLLILDLGLPKMHGLEVLRKLRGRGSSLPVLILTAADSVEERVKGLDYGADDYMAKPFSLQELEARVRALVRRGMGGGQQHHQARPAGVRPGRPRGHHRRQDGRAVGARAGPAGGAAAARRAPGQQGPAGRAPVRMGRRGQQQRDRGLHPPPAQEDRERARSASPPCAAWATASKRSRPPAASPWRLEAPKAREDLPARAALAVRRDPGLDAHAAAAAVAGQPGADLAGGAKHCRQAV
jgi:hypothetical protein